ncbi:unnamed protein product, partial [Amoebophrya sp. A120]|eukprot:GSA120T00012133001.1
MGDYSSCTSADLHEATPTMRKSLFYLYDDGSFCPYTVERVLSPLPYRETAGMAFSSHTNARTYHDNLPEQVRTLIRQAAKHQDTTHFAGGLLLCHIVLRILEYAKTGKVGTSVMFKRTRATDENRSPGGQNHCSSTLRLRAETEEEHLGVLPHDRPANNWTAVALLSEACEKISQAFSSRKSSSLPALLENKPPRAPHWSSSTRQRPLFEVATSDISAETDFAELRKMVLEELQRAEMDVIFSPVLLEGGSGSTTLHRRSVDHTCSSQQYVEHDPLETIADAAVEVWKMMIDECEDEAQMALLVDRVKVKVLPQYSRLTRVILETLRVDVAGGGTSASDEATEGREVPDPVGRSSCPKSSATAREVRSQGRSNSCFSLVRSGWLIPYFLQDSLVEDLEGTLDDGNSCICARMEVAVPDLENWKMPSISLSVLVLDSLFYADGQCEKWKQKCEKFLAAIDKLLPPRRLQTSPGNALLLCCQKTIEQTLRTALRERVQRGKSQFAFLDCLGEKHTDAIARLASCRKETFTDELCARMCLEAEDLCPPQHMGTRTRRSCVRNDSVLGALSSFFFFGCESENQAYLWLGVPEDETVEVGQNEDQGKEFYWTRTWLLAPRSFLSDTRHVEQCCLRVLRLLAAETRQELKKVSIRVSSLCRDNKLGTPATRETGENLASSDSKDCTRKRNDVFSLVIDCLLHEANRGFHQVDKDRALHCSDGPGTPNQAGNNSEEKHENAKSAILSSSSETATTISLFDSSIRTTICSALELASDLLRIADVVGTTGSGTVSKYASEDYNTSRDHLFQTKKVVESYAGA